MKGGATVKPTEGEEFLNAVDDYVGKEASSEGTEDVLTVPKYMAPTQNISKGSDVSPRFSVSPETKNKIKKGFGVLALGTATSVGGSLLAQAIRPAGASAQVAGVAGAVAAPILAAGIVAGVIKMHRSQGNKDKADKLERQASKNPVAALENVSSGEVVEAGNSPEAREAAQEVVVELTEKQKAKAAKKEAKASKKKAKAPKKKETDPFALNTLL